MIAMSSTPPLFVPALASLDDFVPHDGILAPEELESIARDARRPARRLGAARPRRPRPPPLRARSTRTTGWTPGSSPGCRVRAPGFHDHYISSVGLCVAQGAVREDQMVYGMPRDRAAPRARRLTPRRPLLHPPRPAPRGRAGGHDPRLLAAARLGRPVPARRGRRRPARGAARPQRAEGAAHLRGRAPRRARAVLSGAPAHHRPAGRAVRRPRRRTASRPGCASARGDVHRDGDWHAALHIWVGGVDEDGPRSCSSSAARRRRTPGPARSTSRSAGTSAPARRSPRRCARPRRRSACRSAPTSSSGSGAASRAAATSRQRGAGGLRRPLAISRSRRTPPPGRGRRRRAASPSTTRVAAGRGLPSSVRALPRRGRAIVRLGQARSSPCATGYRERSAAGRDRRGDGRPLRSPLSVGSAYGRPDALRGALRRAVDARGRDADDAVRACRSRLRQRPSSSQALIVRSRKPPWCSYEAVTTASASRAARSPSAWARASAIGESSSVGDPVQALGRERDPTRRRRRRRPRHPRRRRVRRRARPRLRTRRTPRGAGVGRRATAASAGRRGRRARARGAAAPASRLVERVEEARQRRVKARSFASCSVKSRSIASSPIIPTCSRSGSVRIRSCERTSDRARHRLELAAAVVEDELDVRERLEAGAEARLRLAHALRDGADAPRGRRCRRAGRDRPRRAGRSGGRRPRSWSSGPLPPVYEADQWSRAPGRDGIQPGLRAVAAW